MKTGYRWANPCLFLVSVSLSVLCILVEDYGTCRRVRIGVDFSVQFLLNCARDLLHTVLIVTWRE